jgi:NAD(P)-dependent dehydrogenase (short-subunit alcohol dehydrogenase family)
MTRLENKVALITGATGGIGEATAKSYLEQGARVMLVGRSPEKLHATLERLNAGDAAAHFVADSTDETATKNSIEATIEAFGGLDIVFANAGTEGVVKPLDELTLDEFQSVITTNVTGVWLSMKHCVAPMRARGGGSIIATSSIGGSIGFHSLAPYIASKHAVIGLVKTAALELGDANIRVNAIAPGPIDNRMMTSLVTQLSPDAPADVRGDITETIALKRFGTNEEVANLALFLASDESAYCSGGVFLVDGGYTAA